MLSNNKMVKYLFYLSILIITVGCNSNHQEDELALGVAVIDNECNTRSDVDSISEALVNSPMLSQLDAANDSVALHSSTPYGLRSFFKKLLNVACADAYGLGGGFLMGVILSGNAVVGAFTGVVSGVGLSAAAASSPDGKLMPKKLPTNVEVMYSSFDRYTYLALHDANYNVKYNEVMTSVGPIVDVEDNSPYLKSAIHHNLVLEKYMESDSYDDIEVASSLFAGSYYMKIYSDEVLSLYQQDINDAKAGNYKWGYIFSDRINRTQTISQAKAGALMEKFKSALNVCNTIDDLKFATFIYMNIVKNSDELSSIDKNIVLQTLPVYMYSVAFWSNYLEE